MRKMRGRSASAADRIPELPENLLPQTNVEASGAGTARLGCQHLAILSNSFLVGSASFTGHSQEKSTNHVAEGSQNKQGDQIRCGE